MASASTDPSKLKADFISTLGQDAYSQGWSSVLNLSPQFFASSLSLTSVPLKKRHLSPKVQCFIRLAVDAAATHLHPPGIRTHVRAALAAGATPDEVMEVLELVCTVGIHACNVGIPLLLEVLKEDGLYDGHQISSILGQPGQASGQLDSKREQLKRDFTIKRGYWHPTWEEILALDPDFFEAYLEMSTVPWTKDTKGGAKHGDGKQGWLEPKVKELIYCAFDAASQHLYEQGLKLHMRNVFKYGGTVEEIVECLQLCTLVGLEGVSVGAPILEEEAKRVGK